MKQFIFLILVIALVSACKKGQADFVISGVVSDLTFGKPLENATVTITKKSAGKEELIHVATLMTDSEGKYTVDLKRDRFVSVDIEVEKEGYFTVNETVAFSDLSVKTDNLVMLSTTGKSWARIVLKHNESTTTKLDLLRTKGKSGCAECCPAGYQQFVGIIDTVFYCVNDANTTYEITYFKQGTSLSGTKSAVTSYMDTVDIILEY